jgi:hypothetical protein
MEPMTHNHTLQRSQRCPNVKMDGGGDGVSGERQWRGNR